MERKIKIVRSPRRRTSQIQIEGSGTVVVRVPAFMSDTQIQDLLARNRDWIESKLAALEARQDTRIGITDEMRRQGIQKARGIFPRRVEYFARRMGCLDRVGRITIREQRTRWGSCSSKGNLNFNWKLVLMPEEILDYVVVHELAHLYEMNHSPRFWSIVEGVLPDYRQRRQKLNELGARLQ